MKYVSKVKLFYLIDAANIKNTTKGGVLSKLNECIWMYMNEWILQIYYSQFLLFSYIVWM